MSQKELFWVCRIASVFLNLVLLDNLANQLSKSSGSQKFIRILKIRAWVSLLLWASYAELWLQILTLFWMQKESGTQFGYIDTFCFRVIIRTKQRVVQWYLWSKTWSSLLWIQRLFFLKLLWIVKKLKLLGIIPINKKNSLGSGKFSRTPHPYRMPI